LNNIIIINSLIAHLSNCIFVHFPLGCVSDVANLINVEQNWYFCLQFVLLSQTGFCEWSKYVFDCTG